LLPSLRQVIAEEAHSAIRKFRLENSDNQKTNQCRYDMLAMDGQIKKLKDLYDDSAFRCTNIRSDVTQTGAHNIVCQCTVIPIVR
jgi:hypothetical protein